MQFKLGKRVVKVAKCIFRRVRIRPGNRNHLHHQRLGAPPSRNPVTKLLTWGRKLKSLCLSNGSGYIPIGSDLSCDKVSLPPKGHLAVYVGDEDGDFRRVLVPVIFFNHPLFGDLLKDAEEEFGFQHPRGITIPCRYTEFQRVTRIASGSGLRGKTRRLMWRLHC